MLNERCRVFLDLAEILSDSIADQKMSRITYIIIILIIISICVTCSEVLLRFVILSSGPSGPSRSSSSSVVSTDPWTFHEPGGVGSGGGVHVGGCDGGRIGAAAMAEGDMSSSTSSSPSSPSSMKVHMPAGTLSTKRDRGRSGRQRGSWSNGDTQSPFEQGPVDDPHSLSSSSSSSSSPSSQIPYSSSGACIFI